MEAVELGKDFFELLLGDILWNVAHVEGKHLFVLKLPANSIS